MKNKLHTAVGLLSAIAIITSAAAAASTVLYDFDTLTAGSTPGTTGISTANLTSGNTVLIVGSATTPADPFGGATNKSLYVHRATGAATLPIVQFDIANYETPLTSGTLTFDFYLATVTNGRMALEIDIGRFANTSTSGRPNSVAAFQINNSTATTIGSISYFNNTTSGGSITPSGHAITPNAKNTISVSWDTSAKTYSIMLNDTTIVSSSFTVGAIPGVSSIRFTTVAGGGDTDINYFIDNITLTTIPETSSASLVTAIAAASVGLAATTFVHRRTRNTPPIPTRSSKL
ncbi:hypothetical protein Ga0100231_003845 [Opitutaceae bacterium TAV4]|nr:hypothetical protein Ga0100231_003845 [Opitutaceae bacterium TAV4]RRK02058.1 hypothetical protein Ga0100230_002275 [Opitutaceae bacterium TAV3]